jgi:DNA-binding transcriptional regulator YiaG
MRYFRLLLVIATAIFMAFHTQIFISRIEPNVIFSWTASLLIEGFLISLALSKTLVSRILIIPLFCISVVAASASFIVQNEQLLNQFFTQKRVIEQVKSDLSETQKAYSLGQKYTTKTLQRERQLQDELRAILKNQNGDITLASSIVFFVLVLVVQSVSIYTAASLKGIKSQENRENNNDVPERFTYPETTETLKQVSETAETGIENCEKTELPEPQKLDKDEIITELKRMKNSMTLQEMSGILGISKATLSRIIAGDKGKTSEEILEKLRKKIGA